METIIKIYLILFIFLHFTYAALDGPNYPTNYVYSPVVGVNGGLGSNSVTNQFLTGNTGLGNGGLNVGFGSNGYAMANNNNLGAFETDVITTEIIRRQIQEILRGGQTFVNPIVIGSNGISQVIDPATGVTVGVVSPNGVVTPVGAGTNRLGSMIIGANGVPTTITSTIVDPTTGVTLGYVGANGIVTPVRAVGMGSPLGSTVIGANGLPVTTGLGGLSSINSNLNAAGLNAIIDPATGATLGYVSSNGVVTPATGLNGYGTNINSLLQAAINPYYPAFLTGQAIYSDGIHPYANLYPSTSLYPRQGYIPPSTNVGINPYQTGYGNYNNGLNSGIPQTPYNPYQSGYGSYGMVNPYTNGMMNPYQQQQQQQYGYYGLPMNNNNNNNNINNGPYYGNQGSNSQASASSSGINSQASAISSGQNGK